jgi:hypothetical protein
LSLAQRREESGPHAAALLARIVTINAWNAVPVASRAWAPETAGGRLSQRSTKMQKGWPAGSAST